MGKLLDQTINPICTVRELIDALEAMVPNPATTYIGLAGHATEALILSVLETTLTDGSTVIDIDLTETY